MTVMPKRMIIFVSLAGDIIAHFLTDRESFAEVATLDRDRIFRRVFAGDLTSLPDMGMPSGAVVSGALYQEAEAWRINNRTIDNPTPRARRRRTATIIPFPVRKGGAA